MPVLKVKCPNCERLVDAADVNLQKSIAKCLYCSQLFSIDDQLRGLVESRASELPPQPARVIVETSGSDGTLIKRRWNDGSVGGLLVFCAIWDILVIFFFGGGLFSFIVNRVPMEGSSSIFWLLMTSHSSIGIFLTWYALAKLLNTTYIFIDRTTIIVEHRPIIWPGKKTCYIDDLKSIEISVGYQENYQPRFSIALIDKNAKPWKLTGGLSDSEARFIAWNVSQISGLPLEPFDVSIKTSRR